MTATTLPDTPEPAAVAPVPLDLSKGSNLLINYIPRSVNGADLERLFGPFGAIDKARCITDRTSGNCQGYGFVQFRTASAAAEAVQHFATHPPPENSAMKVSFARPAESHKLSNLHISGLPITYTDDDFKSLFEPYGPVCELTLLRTANGESRGAGFVRLETPQQAHAAVAALHDAIPPNGSSRLNVRFAVGTKREAMQRIGGGGSGRPAPSSFARQKYPPLPALPSVRNHALHPYPAYPPSTSYPVVAAPYYLSTPYNPLLAGLEAQLQSAVETQQYETCAELRDQIQALKNASSSSGSPPADYSYAYGPDRSKPARTPGSVVTPSPYAHYQHHPAPVPVAVPPSSSSGGTCMLYAAGLPYDYDEHTLSMMFGQFGHVLMVKIPRDATTRSPRGFAFVTMAAQEQGASAIAALNGYHIGPRTLQVKFKT